MKKLCLLLTLVFTFTLNAAVDAPPKRVPGLLRFIAHNEVLRDVALYTLISRRCKRYMPWDQAPRCRDAVKKELRLLDYDIVFSEEIVHRQLPKDAWGPQAFVFIAFKKDLVNRLSEEKTSDYLEELNLRLSRFLAGQDPDLNIWEFTLAYYKTPLEAAKTIAALFQDTSPVRLHLAYLERMGTRGRASFDANKELLVRVLDTIGMVLDYSEDNYRRLFYPPAMQEHLNKNIYHFYVPLYLAMALEAEGNSKKFSHAGPLMLTLTYEFITSSPDYRYLMKDPANVSHLHKLRDIFGGHTGASFGIGRRTSPAHFAIMKDAFARSTEEGVHFLIGR